MKVIISILTLIVVSFVLGLLNVPSFNKKVAIESTVYVKDYFDKRNESICYMSKADVSIDYIEVFVETNTNSYFVALGVKNSWVNFTVLNYFIDPRIELITADKVPKKNRCEIKGVRLKKKWGLESSYLQAKSVYTNQMTRLVRI